IRRGCALRRTYSRWRSLRLRREKATSESCAELALERGRELAQLRRDRPSSWARSKGCNPRGTSRRDATNEANAKNTASPRLQNILKRVLFFLIHRQQLIPQMCVRWILSRLRAQIIDGAVEHLQFLSIVRHQRSFRLVEQRPRIGGELVDRIHIRGFRFFDVV